MSGGAASAAAGSWGGCSPGTGPPPSDRTDAQRELHDPLRLAPHGEHVAVRERLRGGEDLAVEQRLVGGAGRRHDAPPAVRQPLERALRGVPELGVGAELPDDVLAEGRAHAYLKRPAALA